MLDPATGLTEQHHDWIASVGGPDPRGFGPTRAAAASPAPAAAPPPSAPAAAAPPVAAAPATGAAPAAAPAPMTPEEAKADLARRLKAHRALYDQVGQKGADDQLPPTERLTAAELKLGTMTADAPQSATTVDEKGITKKTSTTTSGAVLGPDGKAVGITHEATDTTNVGLTGGSVTSGTKATLDADGRTTTVSHQDTKAVDLAAGNASHSTSTSVEVKTTPDASTKTDDKTTTTAGMGGVTRTTDHSQQTGNQLDSTSTTVGVARTDGQLGVTKSTTTTSGTMVGPADKPVMDKGVTTTTAKTVGLVSDDKGTGVGTNATASEKGQFGHGLSITNTAGGGGRCQALVKEVTPSTDPATFTITTTISLDVSIGTSGGVDVAPKAEPKEDGTGLANGKGSGSVGVSASYAKSASYTRVLKADEAKKYLDDIAADGRGGSFPEHQILATGMSQGWGAAAQLYQAMTHSATQAKSMKPGEEAETSDQTGVGAKAGVGGGESRDGGATVSVEASVSKTHKVTLNRKAMPDGRLQLTASIDDATDMAGSVGVNMGAVGGKGGASHGDGKGHVVVFMLDPKDPGFDKLFEQIQNASSGAELDRIAAQNHALLASTTDKTTTSDGESAAVNVGPASLSIADKGTLVNETTRDADGKVIATKSTGTNESGGTVGVGDTKYAATTTTGYSGAVDKDGHATGEISEKDKSSSLGKTMQNLGNITKDPLGAIMHPGKLIGDSTTTTGIDVADPEIRSYVSAALDKSSWNAKGLGHLRDDWIKCGAQIRAAVTFTDGQITNVDKSAVQAALAAWSKVNDSGNNEKLDSVIRPLGGIPTGKAFGFPDGTESMKASWDSLIAADPLEDARAKLAAKQTGDALKAMQAVKQQVASLYAAISSARSKWLDAGLEIQLAEMLGHITKRIAEIDTAIHDLVKTMPPPPKPAAATGGATPGDPAPPEAPVGPPSEADVKEQEARQRAIDAKADLEIYNNNIENMHTDRDSVTKHLADAQTKMGGWFGGVADAVQPLKEAEDLLKIWGQSYKETVAIHDKWIKYLKLDQSRIDGVNPASAWAMWHDLYDKTRDKSMAGRE